MSMSARISLDSSAYVSGIRQAVAALDQLTERTLSADKAQRNLTALKGISEDTIAHYRGFTRVITETTVKLDAMVSKFSGVQGMFRQVAGVENLVKDFKKMGVASEYVKALESDLVKLKATLRTAVTNAIDFSALEGQIQNAGLRVGNDLARSINAGVRQGLAQHGGISREMDRQLILARERLAAAFKNAPGVDHHTVISDLNSRSAGVSALAEINNPEIAAAYAAIKRLEAELDTQQLARIAAVRFAEEEAGRAKVTAMNWQIQIMQGEIEQR